jgi:hypothetical protein
MTTRLNALASARSKLSGRQSSPPLLRGRGNLISLSGPGPHRATMPRMLAAQHRPPRLQEHIRLTMTYPI